MTKKTFFQTIFGEMSWTSPLWLTETKQVLKKPSGWGSLLGFGIILGAAFIGYCWYQQQPKPNYITAHITAPEITPVEAEPEIKSLTVDFGTESESGAFIEVSTAPLNQVGKPITSGIQITPNLKGKWAWVVGSQMIFNPTEPWAAGQTYSIDFDKKTFAKKVVPLSYEFSTQPLKPEIKEFKFYQDPKNPELKQAVATIQFNYPVNTKSLASHLILRRQSLTPMAGASYKFTIDFDKFQRTAYVHSETLALENEPYYLELVVDKGLEPKLGLATTKETIQKTLIPSKSTLFKVSNVDASIVRDAKNNPEQVLNIETSLGVKTDDLIKALHVYELPKDLPERLGQEAKPDYAWENPGEVNAAILQQSKAITLQPIATVENSSTLHGFKFKAENTRYLFLQIDRGLMGAGEINLAQDYQKIIPVPDFPREVTFLHQGSLLGLSSEKKLSLFVRGIPAVQFSIARVLPDDLNHLVSQTSGNFNSPDFITEQFNQNNISQIFSEVREFNVEDPSAAQYTALDLDRYLKTQDEHQKLGLFLLTIREWDTQNKTAGGEKAKRLILVTDMGLIVKKNSDASSDIFVQSISQGTPVASAQVSILGKNGVPLVTQTTDARGTAHFPNLKDFTQDREPTVYVVHKDTDVSFMPFETRDRGLEYSRFDVEGVTRYEMENNITAFLFSDRTIYRPGDLMHLGFIVKQSYAQQAPAGVPLEATIVDPRGATVLDQKITLPASNFFTLDYTPSSSAPTGVYSVSLYTVKDGKMFNLLGSTQTQVEEFLPDRIRIQAQLIPSNDSGWISPNKLTAKVSLQNLFGTPAQNRRVTGKVILTPQAFQFTTYPGYLFTDPLSDSEKKPETVTETLQDARTDTQGMAIFNIDLSRFTKATYKLDFYTEGFEAEGGRSVVTQKAVLVSPLTYLIGYKTTDDLSYLTQNSERKIHFIAIDPNLKQIAQNNLKTQLFTEQKIVTLVKKPDGTYEYQTVTQTIPLQKGTLNISAQGTDYVLPTDKIGDYILQVTDQNDMLLNKIKFSVVGMQQASAQKQTELKIKLNKKEFKAGEDIELQVTAPYTGAGLISIERDKTYAFQWFKATSASSIQHIHIPEDFQGDAYVNVAFVRAWDSDDIFSNPLSYAVAPFSVNRDAHTVKIQLQTPDLVQPGEKLPITYRTNIPSKIVVFAVDEGILQVTKYKTPDPLGYFFRKHALEVATQQIVDQILPNYLQKRELSAIGGGAGEESLLANNLNPFKRKNKLPVVYWSGIVDADQTPRELNYTVPDYFNGGLRVMSVAVADNAVGSTDKNVLVRGDFIINANVPTFVAPNDEFDVSVSVANNLKNMTKNIPLTLKLTASSNLQVLDSATQTAASAPNSEQTLHFHLRALDQLGEGELKFVASGDGKNNQAAETLSVRPAVSFETRLNSGFAEQNKKVDLENLYPEFFSAQAELSASPLILVNGLQRYLDNFPFSCTEQLVSKAFVAMTMAQQPISMTDKNTANEKIQLAMDLLRQRQTSAGSFSYWPGLEDYRANKFISVYAMQFLTEARERGFNISDSLFNQGIGYLQSVVSKDAESLNDAREIAYAIYILTRNENVTTNYITNLQLYLDKNYPQQWKTDIIAAYLAASYQIMKNEEMARKLITPYAYGKKSPDDAEDFTTSRVNDPQYLAIISRYFPDELSKRGADALLPITQNIMRNDFNTLSAAYSALALSTYANNLHFVPVEQTIMEILAGGKNKLLAKDTALYLRANVDNAAQQILFASPVKPGFFFQTTQAGFAKTLPTKSLQQGMEIYREYRDTTGKVISTVPLGSEIEVHIQVRANQTQDNVAIVDLLPGGFEVVRDSLKDLGRSNSVVYHDAREDRVVFFAMVSTDNSEIIYRIKATNLGTYTVPPILATAMYNPAIKARGVAEKITVVPPSETDAPSLPPLQNSDNNAKENDVPDVADGG